MKNIFIILSFFIILLTACENKERNLFRISEPNGQENDFLFMAESTNVREIGLDSIMFYLTLEEFVSAEKLTFKNFGKIHSNQRFDVHILLKEGSGKGRNYTFIIRTFDSNFMIIDSYELASWIDSENLRCYGSIDENLIINRSCENAINNDVRQILSDGRIVATSFHKS